MTTESTASMSQGGRELLQHRVAQFGIMGGGLGLTFLIYRTAMIVGYGHHQLFMHGSYVWHAVAVLPLFSMWVLCRGRLRSRAYVHWVEAFGLIASSAAYQFMGASLPLISSPYMTVLLALTFGLVGRAIYVPSTARRTLVLSAIIGVPYVASVYAAYSAADPQFFELVGLTLEDKGDVVLSITAGSAVWWALSTTLATAASTVVYGLRKEVRDIKRLGQYVLEFKLGEGGMGVVYRARHAMLRRPTAIKLLRPEKAGEAAIARFEREVQLTARLTHPNTVTIFDYGRTPEGLFYYAMELLDGATLLELVERDGPQPPARVAQILEATAGALTEAHGLGLVHRDIKPANIMLCEQGGAPDFTKVLDFGLVKELDRTTSASLTAADSITGTPQYMPPEVITAPDKVDGRSDLYALGAVGYYLLTGEHVFEGNTLVEVCSHHLHSEPVPPAERLGRPVPEGLSRILLTCLAKDQAARPQSALELRRMLRECADLGEWTEDDARSWWQVHGMPIRGRQEGGRTSASDATINVDFGARGRPPKPV